MKVGVIKRLDQNQAKLFIPPLSDYAAAMPGWSEAEFRHLDQPSGRVIVGYWKGEPGQVTLDPWPYTEVCSILSGKVAIRDTNGDHVEFLSGEAFMIPKGFVGDWITLEPTAKIFVAIS